MTERTSLEILHPGIFTSLQDGGRPGFAYFAVPRSGPADPALAERANDLVGNRATAAVIEFNLMGAELRFDTPATIALTGADFRWRLDKRPLERERRHEVSTGAILEGTYATHGVRGYLAVAGESTRAAQFGSVAMHAQIHGRLARGETLGFARAKARSAGRTVHEPRPARPVIALGDRQGFGLELLPGPEWNMLDAASQHALRTARWSMSPQSDRVGTRLQGPLLRLRTAPHPASVPVWVNCVQVDPSGGAIVVGVDGGVLGGYPRVATLTGVRV